MSPLAALVARRRTTARYANNTNVRRDSDVDVAVEWTRWFYVSTVEATEGMSPDQLGYNPINVGPTPAKFRAQVERAVFAAFGAAVDATGDKAITVSRGTDTLDADVVPCFELHRFDARRVYHVGQRIFPRSSGSIVNDWTDRALSKNRSSWNDRKRTGRHQQRVTRRP